MLTIAAARSFELGAVPGFSVDVAAITKARTTVGKMLDALNALPANVKKRVQRPDGTFQSFAIDRASNLEQYVSGPQLMILQATPIVAPLQVSGTNVVLWPNKDWDDQLAAWQTLAVFANLRTPQGLLVPFALERGTVEKVLGATQEFLAAVDAKLKVAQIPTGKRPIWPYILAATGAAAVVIGGTAYATRDKAPPMPARKGAAQAGRARQLGNATALMTRQRVRSPGARVGRFAGGFFLGTSAAVLGGATGSWLGRRIRGTNGDVLLELSGVDLALGTGLGFLSVFLPEMT